MRVWRKIRERAQEDGLAEEMRSHRAMIEDRLRAEGLSPAEARTRAEREFGPLATAIEDRRAEWTWAWVEALWSDARYACRALARDKTFAATAVLTLAAGLALASVAFTLFNAYVLRPFAVRDPQSLYEVHWIGKDAHVKLHPWRIYEELRARKDLFVAATATRGVFVSGVSRHWSGQVVSGNYFAMLGARVAMGRAIEDGDQDVVVISHAAWQSAFAGDPGVLGKTILLRGRNFKVIGVAGQEFGGLDDAPADFWAPMSMLSALRGEDEVAVEILARLRDGVTQSRAEAALATMAEAARPGLRPELPSRATAMQVNSEMLLIFTPVVVALALVLATCCANVANMLLARGLARQREIGIRLSVGAGRARLVRQLLTEALVIAMVAGATGFALATVAMDAGQRLFFATAPVEFTKMVRLHSLAPDYRVFAFALGAAALAAVGAALVPALQATRPNLTAALRGEFGAAFRASRLRDAMVVFQVIVCTVLLACGTLLYRRADVFQAQDSGMRERGVISIGGDKRPLELAAELRTQPEVEAVAGALQPPFFGRLQDTMVIPAGQKDAIPTRYNVVSANFFQVMGIRLTAGRGFTDEEARQGAPVAIVSQATARAFWPGENPLGKTIRSVESRDRWVGNLPTPGDLLVIGVARDALLAGVFDWNNYMCLYAPSTQLPFVLALVRGDENAALARTRQWMLERFPRFESESLPLGMVLSSEIYPFRAAAWFGWTLGLLAMTLTISGMYGVMSYLVNQRRKEIGIRMALGASPGGVVGLVLKRSVRLAGIGVAVGGGFAAIGLWLLVTWAAELKIVEWDPVAVLTGVAIAGAAVVMAAFGPSARAARVDPNTMLRADE